MTSSKLKTLLLAGTALVAVSAFSTQASAAVTDINGADAAVAADPAASPAITFTTDNIATVNDTINVTGTVTAGTTNFGTLTVAGTSTFSAAVGVNGGNVIKVINAGVAAKTATFSSTVDASTLNVTGTGGVTITGLATVANTKFAGAGTLTLNGGLTGAIDFQNVAGTVVVADGKTITGAITSTGGAAGILTVSGTSTFASAVGTSAIATINAGVAAKTATFSGAVKATTINVTGTGEAQFDSTITATNINFAAAGTLDLNGTTTSNISFAGNDGLITVADAKNITGNIDATTTKMGTVTIEGTSTITGTVGATQMVKVINAGATGKTVTITGATQAETLNFTGDGTVTMGGAYAGAVTTATDGYGTLNLNAVSAALTTIGTGTKSLGKLALGANATASGAIYADAVNLGISTLTTGTDFTLASGQSLSTTITGAAAGGDLAVTGTLALASGSSILLDIDDAYLGTIVDGATYGLATATAATTAATIVSYVPGYNVTAAITGGNTVTLTFDEKTAAQLTNTDRVYEQIIESVGAKEVALQAAIAAATTVAERDALIEAAMPVVDGSAQVSVMDAAVQVQDVTDTRLAALRTGDVSGMAAGDDAMSRRLWLQGYYSYADQNERDGIDGYDADTSGVMLGVDSDEIIGGGVLGLAVNYGVTTADSENAATTDTQIDSYGLTAYLSQELMADVFADVQVGYSYNDVEINNHNCGGAGLVCNGNTNSDQYSAKLALGRDFATDQGMTITPTIYTSYIAVNTDGYTETGTGAIKTVADTDVDAMDVGLDITTAWEIQARDGVMKPSINLGYAYAVENDAIEATSTFVGGGVAFKTTGAEGPESKFNVGVGFVYETNADWDVSAKYNAGIKEDYYSHNGAVRFTTHF